MLFSRQRGDPLDAIEPIATMEDLVAMQAEVREVLVKEPVAEHLLRIVGGDAGSPRGGAGGEARGGRWRCSGRRRRVLRGRKKARARTTWSGSQGRCWATGWYSTTEARYGGTTARALLAGIVKDTPVPV